MQFLLPQSDSVVSDKFLGRRRGEYPSLGRYFYPQHNSTVQHYLMVMERNVVLAVGRVRPIQRKIHIMMKYFPGLVAVLAFSSLSSVALTQEAAFLKEVSGSWTGSGTVKVRTNSAPVKVTCNFESGSTETTLKLDGNCRGLVVVSRAISADLRIAEGKYSGSYVGAGTGTAGLSGKRTGNKINLGIRWAKRSTVTEQPI